MWLVGSSVFPSETRLSPNANATWLCEQSPWLNALTAVSSLPSQCCNFYSLACRLTHHCLRVFGTELESGTWTFDTEKVRGVCKPAHAFSP